MTHGLYQCSMWFSAHSQLSLGAWLLCKCFTSNKFSLSAQLLWLSAVTPGQPTWIWATQQIICSHLCYCAASQTAKEGDPAVKASCWKPPLMPPDPCDIDSFSGSHATGLGSARISCFLPVFSGSVLEIPTQFPSPPAHAPRASMHPSALGDPFHPALLSACSTLPVHRRLETHGLTCCLLCVCVCVLVFLEGWSIPQKEVWENLTGQQLQWLGFHQRWNPYTLFSCPLPPVLFTGWFSGQWEGQRPSLNYPSPCISICYIHTNTSNKNCYWYFSMTSIKCWESVKLSINCKI